MAQIFPQSANRLPLVVALAALVVPPAAVGGVWYYFSPRFTDVGEPPVFVRDADEIRPFEVPGRLATGQLDAAEWRALCARAGIDGIERSLDPGPPTLAVYEPPVERALMPFSLGEALDALEADPFMREKLGGQFLQAFTAIKRTEARRFALAVTDWELKRYFEII